MAGTLLIAGSVLFAQSPAPAAGGADKVVAVVGGKPMTAPQIESFVAGLPNQFQQMYAQDREAFLKQMAMLYMFSDLAMTEKVDQMTPYKQRLEFSRLQTLAQGYVETYRAKITVADEEVAKFYEESKDNFQQAKLQVLLVGYAANPAPAKEGEKQKLNEEQAKAKAEDLVKQLRGGADFKALVEANSDDVASRAKGGDFGTIRRSDQIPPDLSKAIFSLKAGEYSDPVKQPNGFYIFKVTEYTQQPLEELKATLTGQLKDKKFQQWLQATQSQVQVKVEDPEFFGKPKAPPAKP